MRITDRRILLYYILNIFLVLNMMMILFVSVNMLKTGDAKTIGVFNFFINTLFFTVITKGIVSLVMRLPKREQIILLFMSFIFSIIMLLFKILLTVFIPQIIIQLILLFYGVYIILYNYIVLKNIRQFIPLVVLTSIYAFFTISLFIIMFIDIYKVFFQPDVILSGILSIIIVFVSLEMLQHLSYVFIPEYYSKSAEIIDLFDEIKFKYDIRERNIEEQERLKNRKIVERRMIERQKKEEREKLRNERKQNRKNLKTKINPLTKERLNKHINKINKEDLNNNLESKKLIEEQNKDNINFDIDII